MRGLVALALCVPLAGCFSLTAKSVPEWAMSPQVAGADEPRAKPRRATVAQRQPREVEVADRTGAVSVPTNVQPAGLAKDGAQLARASAAQPREVTAFSAEWKAREDAADEKLRRSMSICRGC